MPIANSDIIIYGSADIPEDDSSTSGGAIDKSIKMLNTDMGDIGGADTLDVVSDDATDTTQTVTITGRNSGGSIVTDTYSLNGTTPDTGTTTFARILKVVVNATFAGTITVTENSGSQTLCTLEGTDDAPGGTAVQTVRRNFYAATAEASGGSSKVFYEKVFVANTHDTLDLLGASITLSYDGSGDNVDFDLEGSCNDNNSVTNRLTEPAGADMLGSPTWNDSAKNVPCTNLGNRTDNTSDYIGVWLRLTLAAGETPANTYVTINVAGSST